jgi:hypothetical protein
MMNNVPRDSNFKGIDDGVHRLATGTVSWASDPNGLNFAPGRL